MPPVLADTDAALMSSQVDGTVLVLGSGDIGPDEGKQAKRDLMLPLSDVASSR